MNQRAGLVQRAARDFVQRLRVMLGNTGDDANEMVDKLDRNVADHVAGDVCATLGVEYETDPNPKRHPWAKKGFASKTAPVDKLPG